MDGAGANRVLAQWVDEVAAYTKPTEVRWCDGGDEEYRQLIATMLNEKLLTSLNASTHPRSYLHRSAPSDVARSDHLTFISTPMQVDAGPTNNWMSQRGAERQVWPLFAAAMRGRTMYVVPYLLGPVDSPYSRVGVQLTDSAYVVASLRIMTHMGRVALHRLGKSENFVRGVHSLGDFSPERRFIVHFPETQTIWSIGSGYGDNALLSKKCHALRVASAQARREGWLAEHMLVMGVTSPAGEKHYLAAALPSGCGKTNLAMLVPSLPGWKIETVGEDICWLHVGKDGRLWAINPEAGMLGVAPGTNGKTNPNALASTTHDAIFTNTALRSDGSPWWEGLSELGVDELLTDWKGLPWRKSLHCAAAHPNARFMVSIKQCPIVSPAVDDPKGVPISAIVFGGRRAKLAPLLYEAFHWNHGVLVGATMVSETTAAATDAVGVPRHDPMAMLPFCGYNMGDYFGHWVRIGQRLKRPPKIFHVNWFRTDDRGRLLWPGFGENIRAIEWMLRRLTEKVPAISTPIGLVPRADDLNTSGLDLGPQQLSQLLRIDWYDWLDESSAAIRFLSRFGDRLPPEILHEHALQVARLRCPQA